MSPTLNLPPMTSSPPNQTTLSMLRLMIICIVGKRMAKYREHVRRLFREVVVRILEALRFVVLPHEGLHDPDAREVLLEHCVELVEPLLNLKEHWLSLPDEDAGE